MTLAFLLMRLTSAAGSQKQCDIRAFCGGLPHIDLVVVFRYNIILR
jgi:hypothetical protein